MSCCIWKVLELLFSPALLKASRQGYTVDPRKLEFQPLTLSWYAGNAGYWFDCWCIGALRAANSCCVSICKSHNLITCNDYVNSSCTCLLFALWFPFAIFINHYHLMLLWNSDQWKEGQTNVSLLCPWFRILKTCTCQHRHYTKYI